MYIYIYNIIYSVPYLLSGRQMMGPPPPECRGAANASLVAAKHWIADVSAR